MERINRESNWYDIFICAECLGSMSDDDRMYSNGVCKHCGYWVVGTVCSTRG